MIICGGGRERKENLKFCIITTLHRLENVWGTSAIYKFYFLACIHALCFNNKQPTIIRNYTG